MPIVLDNSVVMSWSLADEADPVAERAMQRVVGEGAVVPGIWWYELRNAFVVNERRGRLDAADTGAILADLSELRITLDSDHDDGARSSRSHASTACRSTTPPISRWRCAVNCRWRRSTNSSDKRPPPVPLRWSDERRGASSRPHVHP